MSIYEIIANIHGKAELPAMLFALRLGGPRRRSYCRPKFDYVAVEKSSPGFISRHPVLFVLISLLIGFFIAIAGSK